MASDHMIGNEEADSEVVSESMFVDKSFIAESYKDSYCWIKKNE